MQASVEPFARRPENFHGPFTPCATWEEFLREVRRDKYPKRLFRGQRDVHFELQSLWERSWEWHSGHSPTTYLERFKEYVTGLPGLNTDNFKADVDWWTFGRHYGLITPYLDWTKSPFIAAFFAFSDLFSTYRPDAFVEPSSIFSEAALSETLPYMPDDIYIEMPRLKDEVVAIWELLQHEKLEEPGVFKIITQRRDFATRQRSQRGVFTHLNHAQHNALLPYLQERGLDNLLQLYTIPATEIFVALHDLELMNITYVTIFNDIVGATMQANLPSFFPYKVAASKIGSNDREITVGSKEQEVSSSNQDNL